MKAIRESLQNWLSGDVLPHLVAAILIFLVVLMLGWLLKLFLNTIGRKLILKTRSDIDDIILGILVDNIKWIAIVAGAYLATEELTRAASSDDVMALKFLKYAEGIIFVSFVIVVTVMLIRMTDRIVNRAMEAHARRMSDRLNEALLPLINRIINIILGLIAIIIILDHFGQDVSSLVVSLGVGSLAIALAAQDTLSNMIGGFVIMLDRPFRVGDRIQLPSGEMGDVHEIGIRSTKILDFDNNLVIIPNAELVKGRITNYSYPADVVRIVVEVSVAYGTDLEKAKYVMTQLAREHPLVLGDPAPEIFVVALADSSVNLRLVARTQDYRNKFLIETKLREQIYNAFHDEGIEIPFPQRVIHFQNAKTQTPQKRKTLRR
jgi:small-conductance mechanosensitive channel